jgi:hypothetical protein
MSNAVENTQCCVICDEQITGEVMTFEDETYCQTCHDDEIRECDSCQCQNHVEHTIYIESSDELVCEPCSERHYEPCTDCDELQRLDFENLVTICQQVEQIIIFVILVLKVESICIAKDVRTFTIMTRCT